MPLEISMTGNSGLPPLRAYEQRQHFAESVKALSRMSGRKFMGLTESAPDTATEQVDESARKAGKKVWAHHPRGGVITGYASAQKKGLYGPEHAIAPTPEAAKAGNGYSVPASQVFLGEPPAGAKEESGESNKILGKQCNVCGGKFVQKGKQIVCNQCGDTPFSPEQATAGKHGSGTVADWRKRQESTGARRTLGDVVREQQQPAPARKPIRESTEPTGCASLRGASLAGRLAANMRR